jgi:xanthine dehydrogenase molybdopterin-binding subunit B
MPAVRDEAEVFSNHLKVTCDNCGFVAGTTSTPASSGADTQKECVGEEVYRKLNERKRDDGTVIIC